MKCAQALETMLDAEPADLSPDGTTALALHLRSCARCARVAATIGADVRVLAAVMPPVPVRTQASWVRWPGVALACAAAVLLFAVMRARPVPTGRSQSADATPVVVAQPTEPARASIPARTTPAPAPVRRVASTLYAMPEAVPLEAPDDLPARAFNGVSASSNGSVTVLNTANPKITVIWFN